MILTGKVLGLAHDAVAAVVHGGNGERTRLISHIINHIPHRYRVGGSRVLQAQLAPCHCHKRLPLRKRAEQIVAAGVLDHNGAAGKRRIQRDVFPGRVSHR